MPYVSVDWVTGQSAEKRAEVARRINAAVSEVTGIPADMIWVTFNHIEDDCWYVGKQSVREMRSGGS